MLEKDIKNNKSKYVSCIKINGIPILPPLITNTKRKEIHKYKQEAIKLENQLKREEDLKKYINTYYTPNLGSHILTNSLEHKLVFEDESDINDIENSTKVCLSKKEVPSAIKKKIPQLCCDLQVSQYTNNEFTVLTSFEKCKSDIELVDAFTSHESNFFKENISETKTDISDNQGPRLVRSNSYILESPSPMLLEHLRKQYISNDIDKFRTISSIDNIEQVYTKETHSLDEPLLINDASQDDFSFTDHNSIYISRSESELKDISSFSNPNSDNNTIMENQYHIRELIDNNVPQMLDNMFLEKNVTTKESADNQVELPVDISNIGLDHSLHNSSISYDNETLIRVLNNIPEVYSKQILELLEKQKQQQLSKLNTSTSSKESCFDRNELNNDNVLNKDNLNLSQDKYLSELDQSCRSEFINLPNSLNTTSDTQVSHMSQRHEEDSKLSEKTVKTSNSLNKFNTETGLNCSRELFPMTYDKKLIQPSKEEHAASIIGAAAKGYLIRRLMRTYRVQGLIQTIRDALICAMQLHTESTDNINESDVELHRRLIQQVSAACFEFHDIFFSITNSEQMNIIRADREKQKEKLKRPLSRVSSASKSTRTSRSSISLR